MTKVTDVMQGTLDLLILKALTRGALHGYAIVQMLKDQSDEVVQVGESSLYPALQRLLLNGWVKADWGASENNRRARFYTLTASGRKRLASERQDFDTNYQQYQDDRYQRVHALVERVTDAWLVAGVYLAQCPKYRQADYNA